MASEDELALTATAPSPSTSVKLPPREVLGRFRIERKLGEGGMGVVHAAFDPDLERRIALKVLRHASSDDARARLLREARAMAKLSHPNVITVFDVGSADDQDFVAMELIDGETLGEWMQHARPRRRETLAAFMAAGRGLAAAHAEGLVHRDFKPSNVLRSRAGRIVVTDFGLARLADSPGEPVSEPAAATSGATTRTVTGALVGTPAYMAPEQWTGGTPTPATDQFAFCVALWEALAGARPYAGTTLDELKTAVLAGPASVDSEPIPRALRGVLRRGLAIDPAHRWPSMDALLGALEQIIGRRRRVIITAAALAAVAGVVVLVVAARRPSGDGCSPPAFDPAVVWSKARATALAARAPDAARVIAADIATWNRVRPRACTAAPQVRSARLACLDSALERLDAVVGSAVRDRGPIDADSIAAVLVDPAVCDRDTPPRLAAMTPELGEAFELLRRAIAGPPINAAALAAEAAMTTSASIAGSGATAPAAPAAGLAERAEAPCTRVVALLARLTSASRDDGVPYSANYFRDAVTVSEIADKCSDDQVKAMVALRVVGPDRWVSLERAEAAVAAFPQDDLRGELERLRAGDAIADEKWEEGWSHLERAIELAGHRHRIRDQLVAVTAQLELLIGRGRPEDLARIDEVATRWRPIAAALGPSYVGQLDRLVATAHWLGGNVAAADAAYLRLGLDDPQTDSPLPPMSGPIDGLVVDESGAPVAGAAVAISFPLASDSEELVSPIYGFGTRRTLTDRDGRFSLEGKVGVVGAQHGTQRSAIVAAARNLRLVLHPTSRVEGSVELGATPASRVWVVARTEEATPHLLVAPVLATGRFSLDRVPIGKLAIGVTSFRSIDLGATPQEVTVGREPVTGVTLTVSQARLYVIARSADVTPPDAAMLWLFPAKPALPHPTIEAIARAGFDTTPTMAMRVDPQHVPAALAGHVAADDLSATIAARPAGELVVCALGFAKKQLTGTSTLGDFGLAMSKLDLGCAHVAPDQTVVTVEVPPVRKLSLPK